ncbi:MAG: hypothetical protein ACRDVE_20630 [Actinocrinis sp.]
MTAATNIPVTQLSRAGTASVAGTAGDVANGNAIANDGNMIMLLTNGAGVSHTATVTAAVSGPDGLTLSTKEITVLAGDTYLTDVWPTPVYGSTLHVQVDDASLTISPYRHS